MRTGFAPGKVILLGEHAVVFGARALAAALPFGVTVRAEERASGGLELIAPQAPSGDPRVLQAVELVGRALGVEHARIEVSSDLPVGGGLGSSAAFAVATCRALSRAPLDNDEVRRIAYRTEQLFHGTPSGVDNAVIAHGGLISFVRGEPPMIEPVHASAPFSIVTAFTGKSRQTSDKVASLRRLVEQEPERGQAIVLRLGSLASDGAGDVAEARWQALGAKMGEAHAILASCGLSSPELEQIVSAAREAGAWGAKLTGAGGGGAAIAIGPDPVAISKAIEARGYATRVVELGR